VTRGPTRDPGRNPRKLLLTPRYRMPYLKAYDVDIDIERLTLDPHDILCLASRMPGTRRSSLRTSEVTPVSPSYRQVYNPSGRTMPTFSDQVPDHPKGVALPILRTPTWKPLLAIVTSENLLGTYTHFWKGKTMPCEGRSCGYCPQLGTPVQNAAGLLVHIHDGHEFPCEGPACEACQKGIPYRWHAYLSIFTHDQGLHAIFETTAQAARTFVEYRKAQGTLRGCQFTARRLNSKPNGRVLIHTQPANLTNIRLPAPPDLLACMAIIWDFPLPSVRMTGRNPEQDTPRVGRTLPNAGDPTKLFPDHAEPANEQ